jgi:sarcosine oxidase
MTSQNYDVIVAGLGAMGAAALYQLSTMGVKALGIDRFHPPHHFGSSHGESRITRQAIGEGAEYVSFVLRSNEIWRQLEAETGEQLFLKTGIALIVPKEGGPVHHGKTDFVGETARVAEKYGIEHEVLSGAELSYRYPQFLLKGDEFAYFEPGAGALFPEKCIAAQLKRARDLGAEMRLGETMLSWQATPEGVSLKTNSGNYSAGKLILSAGAWMPGLVGSGLSELVKIYPQTLHWFPVPSPEDYAPDRFPVYIWLHGATPEEYFYGFPSLGGSASVKVATEQYSAVWDGKQLDPGALFDELQRDMFEDHLRGRLRDVSPQALKSAPCLYSVTPDTGFILDLHPASDRVWIVSACSGHGFKHSAGVSEAMAQWVTTGSSATDMAPFRLNRFTVTPRE